MSINGNTRQTVKAGKSRLKRYQSCTVHTLAYYSDITRQILTVRAAVMAVRCINNH